MSTHALYRFFDHDGELLYVGITMNPAARWPKHRMDKAWWCEVTDITLETYPDRPSVLAAEVEAIKTEHPRYNIMHAEGSSLPPAPAELTWLCDSCGDPVYDGDGVIGVMSNDIFRYREALDLFSARPRSSLAFDYPRPAPWRVCHVGIACELPLDYYCYVIDEVRTPALLLARTAHLMEKTWLADTDWNRVLARAARGHDALV